METVSIIIPTRNSIRTIAACLRSASAQDYEHVDVVVVDNNSTDGTAELAASIADRFETWGPERSAQRNRGASVSEGSLLVFVDSDMVLEAGIASEAVRVFRAEPKLGAVVIPERSFGEGFLARCRSLEKQLYINDPSVEAARIFRRTTFTDLGGYDERLTGPEDFDLPDRALQEGWLLGRVESYVWHDEGRIHLPSLFQKKRRYGRGVSGYLNRSTARARVNRRGPVAHRRALVRDPGRALGLLMLKLVDAAGIATGMLEERWRCHRSERSK